LRHLLTVDPKERISASNALKHPWFIENHCAVERVIDFKMAHDALQTLKEY